MVIIFKSHSIKDVPYRVKWLNDAEVTKYLRNKPTNNEEQLIWFKNYSSDKTKQFYTIFDDSLPIGIVGLKNIDLDSHKAEVFVLIGEPKYWGKSIGRKSLEYIKDIANKLHLDKLYLTVDKKNTPAIRCYTAAGFVIDNDLETGDELFMSFDL